MILKSKTLKSKNSGSILKSSDKHTRWSNLTILVSLHWCDTIKIHWKSSIFHPLKVRWFTQSIIVWFIWNLDLIDILKRCIKSLLIFILKCKDSIKQQSTSFSLLQVTITSILTNMMFQKNSNKKFHLNSLKIDGNQKQQYILKVSKPVTMNLMILNHWFKMSSN